MHEVRFKYGTGYMQASQLSVCPVGPPILTYPPEGGTGAINLTNVDMLRLLPRVYLVGLAAQLLRALSLRVPWPWHRVVVSPTRLDSTPLPDYPPPPTRTTT